MLNKGEQLLELFNLGGLAYSRSTYKLGLRFIYCLIRGYTRDQPPFFIDEFSAQYGSPLGEIELVCYFVYRSRLVDYGTSPRGLWLSDEGFRECMRILQNEEG